MLGGGGREKNNFEGTNAPLLPPPLFVAPPLAIAKLSTQSNRKIIRKEIIQFTTGDIKLKKYITVRTQHNILI